MPTDPTSEFADQASSTIAAQRAVVPPGGRGFFGHPRGLATLFFTELWERFSYYGMRALLILFMTAPIAAGGLGWDVVRAGAVYGLYTSFVYMAALPGGWVADRLLGQRHAVLVGGIIIALGHFTLAIPQLTTFYLGLMFIVIGTGLLKPNISAIVGELYPEGGARRDAGFSIFYMGINTGAFIGPLICGYLGQRVNWHYGFAAAGVGMVLGLIQYQLGGKYLGEAGLHPDRREGMRDPKRTFFQFVGGTVLVLLLLTALQLTDVVEISIVDVANGAGLLILAIMVLYFGYVFTAGGLTRVEKGRVVVIGVLFLAAAMFWSAFEQAGSSLNLFAERMTNLNVVGWEMPASWLQSVNPILIISLAPVYAWLWVALGKREPSSPAKFASGLVLLGLGFVVMIWAATLAATGERVSPMWLVLTYLLHTMGELALSPVGLSTVTKLSPHRMVGQMMGVWFMAAALGNLIAGRVAGNFETLPLPGLFGAVAASTIGAGLLLAVFIRPVRKLMAGVH